MLSVYLQEVFRVCLLGGVSSEHKICRANMIMIWWHLPTKLWNRQSSQTCIVYVCMRYLIYCIIYTVIISGHIIMSRHVMICDIIWYGFTCTCVVGHCNVACYAILRRMSLCSEKCGIGWNFSSTTGGRKQSVDGGLLRPDADVKSRVAERKARRCGAWNSRSRSGCVLNGLLFQT